LTFLRGVPLPLYIELASNPSYSSESCYAIR
jgi:hypothetical protein